MTDLEKKFTQRLYAACLESQQLGYHPTRFITMLHRWHNGVVVAKRLIVSGDIQSGLLNTHRIGRPDLCMESIMLEEDFHPLFSKQELAAAQWRLEQAVAKA